MQPAEKIATTLKRKIFQEKGNRMVSKKRNAKREIGKGKKGGIACREMSFAS